MEKHERRNQQPPIKERSIELLVYGVFTAFDGDKGEYITAWVDLADVLMSVSRDVVIAKLQSFRDGLAKALETALLQPSPAATPAAAAEPAAAPATSPATSPAAAGTAQPADGTALPADFS